MADVNSSLPIRTQNPGDVVAKIADGTTPSQQLAIDATGKVGAKLSDGTGNAITSQVSGAQRALDVGINVGGIQVDPRDVRPLTATDVVTADQGAAAAIADGWPVKPTDGTNSQSYTANDEARVAVTQPLPVGANLIGSVKAQLQDDNELPITLGQKDQGNSVPVVIASDQSPVPVVIEESSGTEVNDYDTAASVAASGTSNHDYTSTNDFDLRQIQASASGKLKIEVQIETAAASGTFNTIAVLFNSTANPNIEMRFAVAPNVVAGARVRVIRTNRDESAQDVYSLVSGFEAP